MSLRLPRPAVAALALGLPLVLTACGASLNAQTYLERPTSDGTNAAVGAIAVRNIRVVPPEDGEVHQAGEDVEVRVTFTNDGPEDDVLVGATSDTAESVQLQVSGDDVERVELPRLGTTGDGVTLVLADIAEQLRPGNYIAITLRFERNGEVTTGTPVETTGEYDADEREHSENFHPIGEEEGGEEEGGGETSGSGEGLPGAGEAATTSE